MPQYMSALHQVLVVGVGQYLSMQCCSIATPQFTIIHLAWQLGAQLVSGCPTCGVQCVQQTRCS